MTKMHFIMGFLLLCNNMLLAQDVKKNQVDTTRISVDLVVNKKDSIIIDDNGKHWVMTTRRRNVTTSFFNIDLGFSNFADNTNYSSAAVQAYAPGANDSWFDVKTGKSINVNLWIVSQKINLINHVVNFKYSFGLELNNYRFKNPVRFNPHPAAEANPAVVYIDNEADRHYSKNKLAADYLTLPVMLNFSIPTRRSNKALVRYKDNVRVKTRDFGLSAGVSVGYLYASRNKTVTSDEGKQKAKDDFGLNPWKISYVAEVNLGYISLYGSYATKSMFKNGMDFTPYNIGLRFGL